MGYLLLVYLVIVLFVFLGLYINRLEPHKPKTFIPLILVSVTIVAAAILTQRPWLSDFLQSLNDWWTTVSIWGWTTWLINFLQSL
ncbi:MAG: hypothetical protein QXO71_05505 [Candidatus Jordarchaeaceae archaeon]